MERNKMRVWLAMVWLVFLSSYSFAQENRYVVYLSDKEGTKFSVEHPEEYLSTRAIDRRNAQFIPFTIEDFPVNSNYIDSLKKYGADVFYASKWLNAVLVQSEESIMEFLEMQDYVKSYEFVAPGIKLSQNPEPVNRSYEAIDPSSATRTSEIQLQMIGAQEMHLDGYSGEGKWIAILDGGFDGTNTSSVFKHLFQNDKIIDLEDFTTGGGNVFQYDDHGTNVFSCVGADYNETIRGTGYMANYSLYVTEDVATEFRIEEYNWLFAVEKADSSGVDIITSSLGYNTFDDGSMDYEYDQLDGETAIITRAASLASSKGMLVICSAGNEGNDPWQFITTPADSKDVIAVGGVNTDNLVVNFSSIGPTADDRIKPDVVALGSSVAVLHGSGNIGFNSGTSFATPLVAGFAAALWQANPALTNVELMDFIKASSDSFSNPDNSRGYGLPNYNSAIVKVLSIDDIFSDKIKVFPNPFSGKFVYVQIGEEFSKGKLQFVVHDANGKLISRKTVKRTLPGDVIPLKVSTYKNGVYFLTVSTIQNTKQVKLLKF